MEYIRLRNFKCFTDKIIHLNQLTVLAGSNNVGKSSVIQGLLMLHASIHNNGFVDLNKSLGVELGDDEAVLNRAALDSFIEITYGKDNRDVIIQKAQVGTEPRNFLQFTSEIKEEVTRIKAPEIYYICAERIGPRLAVEDTILKFRNVGLQGQYTGLILYESNVGVKIESQRWFPGTSNPYLKNQTNVWLASIMPDYEVGRVEKIGRYTQIFVKSRSNGEEFYATNVGFGFSYLLPIIVTCLIAEKGRYVIIENPEVHLHPSAQAALGKFLVKMADSGLNIVIETHSDHIIEGIQLGVVANSELADKAIINTFDPPAMKGEQPEVHEIKLDEFANLSQWPKGFMDQSQKDFRELTKLRNGIK